MRNVIVTLAVGKEYENLIEIFTHSLRRCGFSSDIIIENNKFIEFTDEQRKMFTESHQLKRQYQEFCLINKLFLWKQCNDKDTKYLYLDIDTITLEDPTFIFEEIRSKRILAPVVKSDVDKGKFIVDYGKQIGMNIPSLWQYSYIVGFCGSDSYLFDNALNIYEKNNFGAYGWCDEVYLVLAARKNNFELADIDKTLRRNIVFDYTVPKHGNRFVFKHFSRNSLRSMLRDKNALYLYA